jgi:hypothetical protein
MTKVKEGSRGSDRFYERGTVLRLRLPCEGEDMPNTAEHDGRAEWEPFSSNSETRRIQPERRDERPPPIESHFVQLKVNPTKPDGENGSRHWSTRAIDAKVQGNAVRFALLLAAMTVLIVLQMPAWYVAMFGVGMALELLAALGQFQRTP